MKNIPNGTEKFDIVKPSSRAFPSPDNQLFGYVQDRRDQSSDSVSSSLSHVISILLFVCSIFVSSLESFEKVVIWGHKLHSHTHSYIHYGFFRAFQNMGYPTYWFDNQDNLVDFDFSNALFLTEGQVDQKIPLRSDGIYLIHNCNREKYEGLRNAYIQVYTDDVLERPGLTQLAPCIYFDLQGKGVYMPWATHLFPNEIEENKKRVGRFQKERVIYWVGSIGEGTFGNRSQIDPFSAACKENGISFIPVQPSGTGVDEARHRDLIAASYLAPAIVGEWQKRVGYIPCRIFKNIGYGQFGVTNSYRVSELFDHQLVYNSDTYQLFYDAAARVKQIKVDEIFALMDIVKTKHTYMNRVKTLLDLLDILGYRN